MWVAHRILKNQVGLDWASISPVYDSIYHSLFPDWMKLRNRNSPKQSINSFNSHLLSASYILGPGLEDYLVFLRPTEKEYPEDNWEFL